MQILTLMGSPRKHGNTDAVLRRFEKKAMDAGHEIVRMNVTEYEVAGCLGCDGCQGDLEGFGCVQADDCEGIFGQIQASDLAVYAAPVYCWSFPAQIKALIDRHYCTVKWQDGEAAARLLEGSRAALLLSCGAGAEDNADLTLPMFERQMDYIGGVAQGMYVLDNCTTPLEDASRAEALAQRMANELLAQ
jgi:multimeric flavodoxin WrbA